MLAMCVRQPAETLWRADVERGLLHSSHGHDVGVSTDAAVLALRPVADDALGHRRAPSTFAIPGNQRTPPGMDGVLETGSWRAAGRSGDEGRVLTWIDTALPRNLRW